MEETKNEVLGKRALPKEDVIKQSHIEPTRSMKRMGECIPLETGEQKVTGACTNDNFPESTTKSARTNCGSVKAASPIPPECRKLLFQGTIYTIHDTVLIRESKTSDMIGRIERIIKENGDPTHPKWPMIEVTWYIP